MRDFREVVKQMLEVVPENKGILRGNLEKVSKDSLYKAPEQAYDLWVELSSIVNDSLDSKGLDEEWKVQMVNILTDKQ